MQPPTAARRPADRQRLEQVLVDRQLQHVRYSGILDGTYRSSAETERYGLQRRVLGAHYAT